MSLNRRHFIARSVVMGSAASAAALGISGAASAASDKSQAAIDAFTGGAAPGEGKIDLTAPEIAENGNTVPLEFSVESPMTDDNYVAEVMLLADGNPNPGVATFKFTPMSGKAAASTRVRLAKTQDVIAIAKMSDGSTFMTSKSVKVTIGGCGG